MDTREFPVEAEGIEESPEQPVQEPPARDESADEEPAVSQGEEPAAPQDDAPQGMDEAVRMGGLRRFLVTRTERAALK